ncbi:DUF262 domain-containing protein [Hymenobacter aquaticus]|uniref:DUF262 domain-containing protein n=1 Tax=Hymenobacter aquaticus TaxID=1867101 RepID=A0A4Z0PWR7_9BACT|nr:DUF262 domain-containing protein [Hymenobacter aquaticus]TGE21726.1 DUF262 domain-containing protein [Hymenobacter aquaticus]
MSKKTNSVTVLSAVDAKLQKVHTQSLDLSFNELLDMYVSGELIINPDYQRVFRWSEGAQSRFIESLLLEMPVPPIYVVEVKEGRYMLIDGLQRISTYLHLRGELKASHLTPPINKGDVLKLVDCDIVEELNGMTFDTLGVALQIRLKRAFVRVEVVRKGSDKKFKYHMFKRLNTGGELLTGQQLRNCTIRLLDDKFNDFIIKLSTKDEFVTCIDSITYEQRLGAFDQELVLRFFALKNDITSFKHDVADFLTDYMEKVAESNDKSFFVYKDEEKIFVKTFSIFYNTLGDYSFGQVNKGAITRGFGVYQFEALSVGIQPYIDKIDLKSKKQLEDISQKIRQIKLDPTFVSLTTGGGKNSPGLLRKRIQFVVEELKSFFSAI